LLALEFTRLLNRSTQEKILQIERQGWEARISLAENALQRRQQLEERAASRQLAQLDREAARIESFGRLTDSFTGLGKATIDLTSGRMERTTAALDRAKSTLEQIVALDKQIAQRKEEEEKKAREGRRASILGAYDAAGDEAGKAAFEAAFRIEDAMLAERDANRVKAEEKKARDIETAKRNALRLNLEEQFGRGNAEQLLTDPEKALQALLLHRQQVERSMLDYKELAANRELDVEKTKLLIDRQREEIAIRRAKLEADKDLRDARRAERAAKLELDSARNQGIKNESPALNRALLRRPKPLPTH